MENINSRIFDLMEIFSQQHYVHQDFKGSNPIKKVLPVLVDGFSYDGMYISNGQATALRWYEAVASTINTPADATYDSSLDYCKIDTQDMVELYVKLPGGFYTNTPMGKYNSDWAISFKEGSVRHIYFVAETKGDTSDLQLREVERAKIECARRHISVISNGAVKHTAVISYSELLKLVNK